MAIKYREYPVLKPLPNKGLYELVEPLNIVYTTDKDEILAVRVPAGYQTDGASIPRALWEEVGSPFSPEFMTAAIVHDFHCNVYDGLIDLPDKYTPTVNEMSDLFFDLLREDGVWLGKALTMDIAVRIYKSLF